MFSTRVFFALVALLAVAAAFRSSPLAASRVAAKAVRLSMSPVEAVVEAPALMTQFSQLLSGEMDFGGYAGPAGSLLFIGAIILVLAPPLGTSAGQPGVNE